MKNRSTNASAARAAGGRSSGVPIWRKPPGPHEVFLYRDEPEAAAAMIAAKVAASVNGRTAIFVSRKFLRLWNRRFVEPLSAGLGNAPIEAIPDGEDRKSLADAQRIFEKLIALRWDRHDGLVAVGGGVVTDLVGFAAAVFMRGLRWFGVPTTLVGQVDAGLGGKTGVDFGGAKNMVGVFWNPEAVFLAPTLLSTLSSRDFRSGLAEVVKTGEALRPRILDHLEKRTGSSVVWETAALEWIVRECARAKMSVVSEDPTDRGTRAVLNLGHTVGHAIEAAGGFRVWTHGEAVAMGLIVMNRFAEKSGKMEATERRRIENLILRLGLVPKRKPEPREVSRYLGFDKKKKGDRLMAVVPGPVGRTEIRAVSTKELVREELWTWRNPLEV